jgi:hypothetical protein
MKKEGTGVLLWRHDGGCVTSNLNGGLVESVLIVDAL